MTKTHGMYGTSEYRSWIDMKQRCFNPNHKAYSNYGDRGITVCDRWLNFENFLADMGSRPTAKHSIDRIDNDGDYSPKNCKWSSRVEQNNNRRYNRLITIDDVTLTIAQWTKEMGFNEHCISGRLRDGWSEYDAVMTPVQVRLITIESETRTIAQWTKEMSYSKKVIGDRLKAGWSDYDAVMTPVHIGKLITIENKTYTIAQWTTEKGYDKSVIRNRLKYGWSDYDAVMTPVKQRKTA